MILLFLGRLFGQIDNLRMMHVDRRWSGTLGGMVLALLINAGCASPKDTFGNRPSPPKTQSVTQRPDVPDYYTPTEKQVIDLINRARQDPPRFANEFIEPRLSRYDGVYYTPLISEADATRSRTHEGVAAARECYDTLIELEPRPPLEPSKQLYDAASELAVDQSINGGVGHVDSEGNRMAARLQRHGEWLGEVGEVTIYGHPTAEEFVLGLLIDDGVPGRGHRANLLKPKYRFIGVRAMTHPTYGSALVGALAEGLASDRASPKFRSNSKIDEFAL